MAVEEQLTAADTANDTAGGARRQFLTFSAGEEEYGVDVMIVREIIGWTATTRLPNTPHYMKGVLNLRGSVVPVFDLKRRLGGGDTEIHDKSVIIIVDLNGKLAGLTVDSVSDMTACGENDINPAPDADNDVKAQHSYVSGIISAGDKMTVLLNPVKLFPSESGQLAA